MFKTSLRYRKFPLKSMLQLKKTNINSNNGLHVAAAQSCLCGHLYINGNDINKLYQNSYNFKYIRVHSTHSDQHRQKVVIDTAPIATDKIKGIEVSPEEKIKDSKLREYWKTKIDPYVKLARWDKPIGVYLLYLPCTWSIALSSLAGSAPPAEAARVAALFLVGAGLMRGAGCTVNDMWDRDIDAQVSRTKDRPLASGALSQRQALGFLALQLSLALAVLLQLNCFSVVLGASSVLLVVTYPLAKRYTRRPQLVLGATFNWGALLAAGALRGALDPAALLLYAAALAWTVFYDTIYAHQDVADDVRIGVHSTAVCWGPERSRAALGAALGAAGAALGAAGWVADLRWPYALALAAFLAHGARQIYTLEPNNPSDCAAKFKSNSTMGLIVLVGIVAGGWGAYRDSQRQPAPPRDSRVTDSCFFS